MKTHRSKDDKTALRQVEHDLFIYGSVVELISADGSIKHIPLIEYLKMSKRPTISKTFMDVARVLAKRATCSRRQVGCVLVNERNHILATGYNGVARGQDHCVDSPCAGADMKSGTGHDVCEAIHAEQNALLQCSNVYDINACYTTTAPCMACTKLLMNTSCQKIYFEEGYEVHSEARQLWERAGRSWIHLIN